MAQHRRLINIALGGALLEPTYVLRVAPFGSPGETKK
jgi:hypothetical protein